MKNFDPTNVDPMDSLELQLSDLATRRPPPDWKAYILAPSPVSWWPQPLRIGLAACWAAAAWFYFSTPSVELPSAPLMQPSIPLLDGEFLLGCLSPEEVGP
jgi:hypothetical protein